MDQAIQVVGILQFFLNHINICVDHYTLCIKLRLLKLASVARFNQTHTGIDLAFHSQNWAV